MKIEAEVSLYPLRTAKLGRPIRSFVENLTKHGVSVDSGSMSSRIAGDASEVFAALFAAFTKVAEENEVVLIVKASNACPRESI